MRRISTLSLPLLVGLAAGTADAQEIKDLIRVDAGNRSASSDVTRSIAAYVAARNQAAMVQILAQPRPETAPPISVEALLAAIESNARILEPEAAIEPAAGAAVPQTVPPQNPTRVVAGDNGNATGRLIPTACSTLPVRTPRRTLAFA